ncbi:MAG TPA: glycoside hydrolase family 2 TIM barrel-domain containing protein [Clostridiales bacterium]|nr:glycoside hydrolase family 2 TIM barrel-domain containing protein [Clostridiales bacterium]
MRTVNTLRDWDFFDEDLPISAVGSDETDFKAVTVPHDWAISRPLVHREAEVQLSLNTLHDDPKFTFASAQGFYERWGVAWYRRKLDFVLSEEQTAWLTFDGVFHESTLYNNGTEVGRHSYGYTPFVIPVKPGNVALRVDNSPAHLADRWYSGCGIIRPVTLTVTDKLHIKPFGISVTTPEISDDSATVAVSVQVKNDFAENKNAAINIQLVDSNGNTCASTEITLAISAGACIFGEAKLTMPNPRRWDITDPVLYSCKITLVRDGKAVNCVEQRFGIRTAVLIPGKGFYLNGKNVKLKGVNLHHDLGMTGAAWHKGLARQRLEALKAISCNAIRTSHNPPAAELLDLCDEMGFLVMDEAFDKWETLRYGRIFDACWKNDLDATIDRDRNHPSVVIWSVGNEVNHQGHDDMIGRLKMLTDRVREKDPTRPVTFAMEPHAFDPAQNALSPAEKAELVEKMLPYIDLISCNYQEQWYDEYHKRMPDALIVGTETFPFYRGQAKRFDAYLPVNPWLDCKKDHVVGQFMWAGIDYLGEAVGCGGWPVRGWSGGVIDTAGQLKAKAQLTRSMWSQEPMIAMAVCDDTLKNPMEPGPWSSPKWAEGWNFEHLDATCVRMNVFTNCEEAEIRQGETPLLRRRIDEFPGGFMEFFIPWAKGEITAVGFNAGQEVCRQTVKTADEPTRIQLAAKAYEDGDGTPIIRVEALAADEQGTPCYRCEQKITFHAGEGLSLLGTDNGDLTDHTPYASACRALYHGCCVACFTEETNGPITVSVVTDEGLCGEITV